MQELRGGRGQKQQTKKSAGWRDQSGLLGLCQGASRRPLSITFDEKIPGGNTHLIRFDGDHASFLRAKSVCVRTWWSELSPAGVCDRSLTKAGPINSSSAEWMPPLSLRLSIHPIGLNGQRWWYPTSREKRARLGHPPCEGEGRPWTAGACCNRPSLVSSAGPQTRPSGISYLLYPGRPICYHAQTT